MPKDRRRGPGPAAGQAQGSISRQEFLQLCLVAGGALVGLGAAACGGSDTPTGGDADMAQGAVCANGTTSTISSNHGHTLTVPQADVDAGVDKTYDITGTSPHGHSVTVTAADFAALKQGSNVSATSTSGASHTHGVTVRCA